MPVIYEDGNYLTDKGRALIAKCLASKTLITFTRVTVGSGTIPAGKSPQSMTDLTNEQVEGVISDISTPVPGEAQLVFQVFSRDIAVGFFASEAAVWATDPDEGEILYTYIVIANHPEWIRASNDTVQKFAEFTCISIVDSAQPDITEINPNAITTVEMLDNLITVSENRPPGKWALWLKEEGETADIPNPFDPENVVQISTAPLTAPGDFSIMYDSGDEETAVNFTDNPATSGDNDVIIS